MSGLDSSPWQSGDTGPGAEGSFLHPENDHYRITQAGLDKLHTLVDDEERLEVPERVSLLLALEELSELRDSAYRRCG